MIPILFAPGTTKFTTNGIGRLTETTSCIVKEQLNGIYELEMQYPMTGQWFSSIKHSCIIYALNYDGGSNQAFRIYEITKPLKGIVTIYAEHISYQTNWIPVNKFEASSLQDCISKLKTYSAEYNPFTITTDKSVSSPISFLQPKSLRKMLGGEEGSMLQTYKGEYEWDNYTIRLLNKRGKDNGVTLRYGKNITTIEQEENIENTYTGVYPYWYSEDTGALVTIPGKVIHSSESSNFPYQRTQVVDFSDKFDEMPTQNALKELAEKYITENNIGHPNVNIKVEFIALWQSANYNYIAPLERVKLGDTITVIFETLGINEKAEVIEYEFDVLKERYNSIQIGDPKSNLSQTIVDIVSEVEIAKQESKEYATKATAWLTRGDGYLYIVRGDDGTWRELIAMDTPNIKTAKHVLRLNQYGIGFSDKGVDGPYYQAWTLDGTLSLGGLNDSYGSLHILNPNGQEIGVFNKDGIKFTTSGVVSDFDKDGVSMTNGVSGVILDGTNVSIYGNAKKIVNIGPYGLDLYDQNNGYQIAKYYTDGIAFYDSKYSGSRLLATYDTDGVTLYENNRKGLVINKDGVTVFKNGTEAAKFDETGLLIYTRGVLTSSFVNAAIRYYNTSGQLISEYTTDGIKLYSIYNKESTEKLTIDNSGLYIKDRGNNVATFNKDGITLYKSGKVIASYGTSDYTIYNTNTGKYLARFNSNGFTQWNNNGDVIEQIGDGYINMYSYYQSTPYQVYKNFFEISDSEFLISAFDKVTNSDETISNSLKYRLLLNGNGVEIESRKSSGYNKFTMLNDGISIDAKTSTSQNKIDINTSGINIDSVSSTSTNKFNITNSAVTIESIKSNSSASFALSTTGFNIKSLTSSGKKTGLDVDTSGMKITANDNLIAEFSTDKIELNRFDSSGTLKGTMGIDYQGVTIQNSGNTSYTELTNTDITIKKDDQSIEVTKDAITIVKGTKQTISVSNDGITIKKNIGETNETSIVIDSNSIVTTDGQMTVTMSTKDGIKTVAKNGVMSGVTPDCIISRNSNGITTTISLMAGIYYQTTDDGWTANEDWAELRFDGGLLTDVREYRQKDDGDTDFG